MQDRSDQLSLFKMIPHGLQELRSGHGTLREIRSGGHPRHDDHGDLAFARRRRQALHTSYAVRGLSRQPLKVIERDRPVAVHFRTVVYTPVRTRARPGTAQRRAAAQLNTRAPLFICVSPY